jgi:hypothetical protein
MKLVTGSKGDQGQALDSSILTVHRLLRQDPNRRIEGLTPIIVFPQSLFFLDVRTSFAT